MSYTKGPWKFIKGDDWEIVAGDDAIMGNTTYYPLVPYEADDWHLISAAPCLLEALEGYARWIETGRRDVDLYERAKAAIAKAKGESK